MRQIAIGLLLLSAGVLSVGCNPASDSQQASVGSKASASKIALISITSDPTSDAQEVNMGLTFAGFCVDEGYDVNIFLNVKGVKLATETFSNEFQFKDHSPLKVQLVALAKRGVQIHVCPVCMKDFEISSGEIISQAFVTDKPKLFAKLGADTMVFTY
jgi:predicted peroxiredoxin